MKTKRSGEGMFMIDHRNCSGLDPAYLARQQRMLGPGVEIVTAGAGETLETSVLQCSHCSAQMIRNPMRQRDREWCWSCDRYICDSCALLRKLGHACRPAARQIMEAMTAAANGRMISNG